MKRILKKINDIVLSLEIIVLIAIVILNVFLWFINMEHYVVLSGSMEPEIHVGAMVYVDKNISIEEIETGDIIAFQTNSALVTHRVVEKDDKTKTFMTKGDANEVNDFAPVDYDMYVGKTVFSIPYLGYLMSYINTTRGKIIIVTIVLAMFLSHYLLDDNEENEENEKMKNKKTEEKRKMEKKNLKKGIASLLLLGCVAVGGISAYLTDIENANNEFTVGKINIELKEDNWNPEEGKDITPNKEIAKDPTVTNIGKNGAYVFVEVEVPYANIVVANDDGTKKAAADTELFSYTVNSGWVELGTGTKDTEKGIITHVYAYATDLNTLTALSKEATTPSVFDSVKVANFVENQGLEETETSINVIAKAIQTTDINGGKTDAASVYEVLNNQVPTNVK